MARVISRRYSISCQTRENISGVTSAITSTNRRSKAAKSNTDVLYTRSLTDPQKEVKWGQARRSWRPWCSLCNESFPQVSSLTNLSVLIACPSVGCCHELVDLCLDPFENDVALLQLIAFQPTIRHNEPYSLRSTFYNAFTLRGKQNFTRIICNYTNYRQDSQRQRIMLAIQRGKKVRARASARFKTF